MQRGYYVALLRGVNVGRAKRIAMADLRDVLTGLGALRVRTLLNSGNAVFELPLTPPAAFAARLRTAVRESLGVDAPTVVLEASTFTALARENPLADPSRDPSRLLVAVAQEPAGLAPLKALVRRRWAPEGFSLGSRAAYLWCPEGVLKSRAAQEVGRLLGDAVTTRNWATVLKLTALLPVEGS